MAKPLYLVGTGSDQKLKRNVPKHLVGLAGKTAWIERISHSDAKTAKERAGLFAVMTNTELRKLEDLYAHRDSSAVNEPSALNLDTTRARQIGLWYFNKRDQENQQTGAYLLDPEDPDYNELLDAAAEDCQQAMREASGTMRTTDPRALELLVEHGVLSRSKADQRKKHLSKEATYQTFSIVELNRLFALPLFNGCVDDKHGCHKPGPNIFKRHRYWAPIISLWTGMRMNEILQLEKADFGITETGVRYVHVTDQEHGDYSEGVGKRVKSKSAIQVSSFPKLRDDTGYALGAKADGDAAYIDVDALDQQLDDACLLGGKEFLPKSIELNQSVAHLGLADLVAVLARGRPGLHNHLWRAQQDAYLIDDCGLDFAGRQAPYRAGFRPEFLYAGGDVVPVQPPLLPGVGRRHCVAVRRENQSSEQCRRLPTAVPCPLARILGNDQADIFPEILRDERLVLAGIARAVHGVADIHPVAEQLIEKAFVERLPILASEALRIQGSCQNGRGTYL